MSATVSQLYVCSEIDGSPASSRALRRPASRELECKYASHMWFVPESVSYYLTGYATFAHLSKFLVHHSLYFPFLLEVFDWQMVP